ncbi:MAG: hypothetical protein WCK95_10320 [Alphaproteobacteria bacterium]|jgi:hypothetical protein
MRFCALIGASLVLGACAGRAPNPVAVVQPQDRYMDCAAISAEVQANNKKIAELGSEEGGKVAQNVIVGAAGLFIPILWFGMDFQGTAGKEVVALQSRQQYLATMAEQRCGAVVPLPVQNIPAAPAVPSPAPVPAVVAPVAAPTGATPVSAPAAPLRELDCVDPDGSKFRINGTECPPPSVLAK